MSGSNDWVKNFKTRCEDIGWRVEVTGTNHHKVYDGTGKLLLTVAGTPGNKRTMLNALSQAKRAGLEDLERQVKLQRERDRLQKIEDDRAANEAKLAGIKQQFNAQDVDDVVSTTSESTFSGDLGSVNGVQIVAVAPAMMQTPIMKKPGLLVDGSEIMLADDTVLYRCEKPAATGTKPDLRGVCHKTFEGVNSLRVHMAVHRPQVSQTTTATSTKKDLKPVTPKAKPSPNGVSPTARLTAQLTAALEAVDLLAKGLDSVKTELTELQANLGELQVADSDTLKKAAQFDNLKAMLS